MSSRLPSQRYLNRFLSESSGRDVVLIETHEVQGGDKIHLWFEAVDSPWRQGVWLATEGILAVGEIQSAQMVLWSDTAPVPAVIDVVRTDGLLRLYNVWNTGEGLGGFESQSHTSGTVVTAEPGGVYRYACNDFGFDPAFEKLVFAIRIDRSPGV